MAGVSPMLLLVLQASDQSKQEASFVTPALVVRRLARQPAMSSLMTATDQLEGQQENGKSHLPS